MKIMMDIALPLGIFVLPLLGTHRLSDPAPWIGLVVGWLMMATQPAPRASALRSVTHQDRLSALGILGSMILAQLASVWQFRMSSTDGVALLLPAIGGMLAVTGLSLRIWAIRTLGTYFTATVSVVADQPLVASGPYRIVRHPSYTGAILAAAGVVVAMGSWVGAAAMVLLVVPAYAHRIRVEEESLVRSLGGRYAQYASGTPAVLPRIVLTVAHDARSDARRTIV